VEIGEKLSRISSFQVFAKPAGAVCNLACAYCYYLGKERLYPQVGSFRMPDNLLETYIIQHIRASPDEVIRFSWHGGEPTVLGIDYFLRIVALQRKYRPSGRRIDNGLQTNGTLLDEDWARFLEAEGFAVGLSLDGPPELHDLFRVGRDGGPTHARAMKGYDLLQKHRVSCDILCVVNAHNVRALADVYRFFRRIGATYVSFLPLVEPLPSGGGEVSSRTVPAAAWGEFLCAIFDEWVAGDIGRIKIQIFEEAARTAFGQEHSLCIFRPTCGDIPVVEHNGDFYSCDHYVDAAHRLGNIREVPLGNLLESRSQREFGEAKWTTLPPICRECEVLSMCHGECPKNRILRTRDGEPGLNYLCQGYRRFFNHCRPFVEEVAAEWKRQNPERWPSPVRPAPGSVKRRALAAEVDPRAKLGAPAVVAKPPDRNDPCPCGSGKKYKNCCLGA
jgi:uncharacterized protein